MAKKVGSAGTSGGSGSGGGGRPRRLGRGLSSLIKTEVPVRVDPGEHPGETLGGGTAEGDGGVGGAGAGVPEAHGVSGVSGASGGPEVGEFEASGAGAVGGVDDGAAVGEGLVLLDVERVVPNPYQPRGEFDPGQLQGLADSIRRSGLMQPVVVRVSAAVGGDGATVWELVAGERRWRAAKLAGLREIPALVRALSDEESAEWAVVENVQREDLNPMERAWAFRALQDRFGLSHAEIGDRLGLDRSSVANMVRLTELEESVQALLASGRLTIGHGKVLLSCAVGAGRESLAARAATQGWSVRRLERQVSGSAQTVTDGVATGVEGEGVSGGDGVPDRRSTALADLERQLGEHLGTRVRVRTNTGGTRGRVVLEFYDLDHFDGLMSKLGFSLR